MSKKFLDGFESGAASGLDYFMASNPEVVQPWGEPSKTATRERRKVASLADLKAFQRIGSGTLVHKSTQDLWALKREGEDYVIERLFQGDEPLKG